MNGNLLTPRRPSPSNHSLDTGLGLGRPTPFTISASASRPHTSSPLASPVSSPVSAAQSRRRSLNTPRTPSSTNTPQNAFRTPTTASTRRASSSMGGPPAPTLRYPHAQDARRRRTSAGGGGLFSPTREGPPSEPPQTTFLRERLKARCFAHARDARAARERRVSGKRGWNGASSDLEGGSSDVEMEMDGDADGEGDEDEDDEGVMADELFRRIMSSMQSKQQHQYRVSYALDVGSSLDPDMEDVSRWEEDLQEPTPSTMWGGALETTPEDLEAEELEAYAAACEETEEWDSIADQIFSLSDLEDFDDDDTRVATPTACAASAGGMEVDADTEMA